MKFNLLTSISDVLPNGKCLWLCECGNTKEINFYSVKSGNTKSCGCLQKRLRTKPKYKIHGMCKSRTYESWRSMLSRCKSVKKIYYKGKGVSVCERWQEFTNFLSDMGERPLNHTLDRINPDGNYEPSNCRWSTSKTQCRNRTNNKIITFNNHSATLAEWETITKIPYATIHARLNRGWSTEKSLTTPIDTSKHTFANLKKSA